MPDTLLMPNLFDKDCNSDFQFNINTDYAKNYSKWREREEKSKLKSVYGDVEVANDSDLEKVIDNESATSSSSESESEIFNEAIENELTHTLDLLKQKNPVIYDKKAEFFPKTQKIIDNDLPKPGKEKKPNKMTLKDYERHIVLNKAGKFSDEEDNHGKEMTYTQQQAIMKDSFKKFLDPPANIAQTSVDEHSNNCEDLFTIKPSRLSNLKTKSIKKKNEDSNINVNNQEGDKIIVNAELNDQDIGEDNNKNNPFPPLKELFAKYNISKTEDSVGSFQATVEEGDDNYNDYDAQSSSDDESVVENRLNLAEIEDTLSNPNSFGDTSNAKKIAKYHFEELELQNDNVDNTTKKKLKTNAKTNLITSFPRTLPPEVTNNLMRIEGSSTGTSSERAEKRKIRRRARQDRKRAEKLRAMEEVKRLRGFKLKEIRGKLNKLERVAAIEGLDAILTLEDIDRDYDPEKFDAMLAKMFDDTYYASDKADHKKPVFEDDESENDEQLDFNAPIKSSHETSKKSRLNEPYLQTPKSKLVDPSTLNEIKDLKQNLDAYSNLQFEGMVGNMPTRFKYRNVIPNQFGLDMEEILVANDKELNKWVSLKKMFKYRTEQEELYDVNAYKIKGKQYHKKRKILLSVYEEPKDDEQIDTELAQNTTESKAAQIPLDFNVNSPLKQEKVQSLQSTQKLKRKKLKQESNLNVEGSQVKNMHNEVEEILKSTVPNQVTKIKKGKKYFLENTEDIQNNNKTNEDTKLNDSKNQHKKNKRIPNNVNKNNNENKHNNNNNHRKNNNDLVPADERLLLYGINPKKFKKTLKYKNMEKSSK